ncbi:MAG: 6-pyruvoyl tetrahydropterin synthase family protein [Methanobacteriota archaeon]
MRIEVDGWFAGITFSAAHFIPSHDKCGRLHGHVYAIHAIVEGDIGDDGMVVDFLSIKKVLRQLAEEMDHRVLVPTGGPAVEVTADDENLQVSAGGKRYSFPKDDVVLLDITVPSAEELAAYALKKFLKLAKLPKSVKRVEIGVDESRGQGAWAVKKL